MYRFTAASARLINEALLEIHEQALAVSAATATSSANPVTSDSLIAALLDTLDNVIEAIDGASAFWNPQDTAVVKDNLENYASLSGKTMKKLRSDCTNTKRPDIQGTLDLIAKWKSTNETLWCKMCPFLIDRSLTKEDLLGIPVTAC